MASRLNTHGKKKRLSAKQRKRRKTLLRVFLLGSVVFLFVSVFVYVINQPFMRMRDVNLRINDLELKQQVQTRIDSFYLKKGLFIPSDTIFNFHINALEDYLLKTFPKISSIEIQREDFFDIGVELVMREQKFLVEQNSILYKVDDQGLMYQEKGPGDEGDLVLVFGQSYSDIKIGEKIMPEDGFGDLGDLVFSLQEKGFKPKRILYVNEIEQWIQMNNGFRFIVNLHGDVDAIIDSIDKIINHAGFDYQQSQGKFGEDLEYINIRYGNRIFYCLQSSICKSNYIVK